jgi:hypothetical protein
MVCVTKGIQKAKRFLINAGIGVPKAIFIATLSIYVYTKIRLSF